MTKQDEMEVINQVIAQPVNGGHCFSYQVFCTSERVLLFYGVIPKSHIDELERLIRKETDGVWISCSKVANLAKARYAIGHPAQMADFENRLRAALQKG